MIPSTRENGGDDANRSGLAPSDRHRLLATERRRLALDALDARPRAVDLEDLARDVAEREAGGDAAESTVDQVAIELHHVHLPMMDDIGVVAYDAAVGRVESRPYRRDA